MKYQVYKDKHNYYWVISAESVRYEEMTKNKEKLFEAELLIDCYLWLDKQKIEKYYEIYV